MGKRVVIAGAGGFGRGVYGWLLSSPRHLADFDIEEIAFVDDIDSHREGQPIISTIEAYEPDAHDRFICAIGNPRTRKRIVEKMKDKGTVFHTFVDDRAVIGRNVTIGEGAVICPGVVISADATVGNFVHLNFNCSVGHDVSLGEFTTLSPSVNVMGEVVIGNSVFIGGSAAILPRIEIGQNVTVGAGSTVLGSVAGGITVVGNPARVIEGRK